MNDARLPSLDQTFFTLRAGQQILQIDRTSRDVLILCSGWAFKYFQFSDGRRQILRFLMPGDVLSASEISDGKLSYSVRSLTDVQLSKLSGLAVRRRCLASEATFLTASRFLIDGKQDTYQLLTNMGRRSAEERVAFLLLNLMKRIEWRSTVIDGRYPFPLRQQHIGDAVGLTTIHVNRVLAKFRERGLLSLSRGTLSVTNLADLERIGNRGLS